MDIKDANIGLTILSSLIEIQPKSGWRLEDNVKLFSRDGQCIYLYPESDKMKYWENITCHYLVKEHTIPKDLETLAAILA